jgi:hypothetical protein
MWSVLGKYDFGAAYCQPLPRSITDIVLGKESFTVFVPTNAVYDDGFAEFSGTLFVTRGKLRGPIELDSRVIHAVPRELRKLDADW